jgi:Ca2+-binding EF-hand superfamily protein
MFNLVDFEKKETLNFDDLKKISDMMKFNLGDEEIQEVVNNVAGFGKN